MLTVGHKHVRQNKRFSNIKGLLLPTTGFVAYLQVMVVVEKMEITENSSTSWEIEGEEGVVADLRSWFHKTPLRVFLPSRSGRRETTVMAADIRNGYTP